MSSLSARRLAPFLVTTECLGHLSSTTAVPEAAARAARKWRRVLSTPSYRAKNVEPVPPQRVGNSDYISPREYESLVRDPQRVLGELLYPGKTGDVARYMPLEAAAEIVMSMRVVREGHPIPDVIVRKVFKIAGQSNPLYKPYPLVAIYQLALAIARPGETPHADQNGDMIGKLLHIAKGDTDGPHGVYDQPSLSLVGSLKNRKGRHLDPILLTDYSQDARNEFTRLVSAGQMPLSILQRRMSGLLPRESDPSKRDTLVHVYLKALESAFAQKLNSNARESLALSLRLGRHYAVGDILPRDGMKAKEWWERTVTLGWKRVGLDCTFVGQAAMELARVYRGQQPESHGSTPLFALDLSKSLQYLHLIKWTVPEAAHVLGKLYYLDIRSEECPTIEEHIAFHGVIPDDALAAKAFFIGAQKLKYSPSKYMFALMLYLGRAHPPVDSTITKVMFVPRPPLSLGGPGSTVEWCSYELDEALSLSTNEPVIEFAPRSRRETLEYTWKLVEPLVTGKDRGFLIHRDDPLANLSHLIDARARGKAGPYVD